MTDYRDNLTLGEIGENDLEMVKDAIKNANKYSFKNKQSAMLFIRHCMDCTLLHLGITPPKPTKNQFANKRQAQILDQAMKKANVKIEGRNNYHGNDMWRRGIYIYKDGVLVAFISNVMGTMREEYGKGKMTLISKGLTEMYVVTNARNDVMGRVYGPGKKKSSLSL
jgi:hypothetical protein